MKNKIIFQNTILGLMTVSFLIFPLVTNNVLIPTIIGGFLFVFLGLCSRAVFNIRAIYKYTRNLSDVDIEQFFKIYPKVAENHPFHRGNYGLNALIIFSLSLFFFTYPIKFDSIYLSSFIGTLTNFIILFTFSIMGFKRGQKVSLNIINEINSKKEKTERITKKYLYLDDVREPSDSLVYLDERLYARTDWVVVRNYNEFVSYIINNGIPDVISFDHDLADSHYTPEEFWSDYEKSKEWQEKQIHTEQTGEGCIKWLLEYYNEYKIDKVPHIMCHSQNPVGADKIMKISESFKKNP